jgi:hypothetical protein
MSVTCKCCLLSGRGLCVGLITRPEESYRLWCVSECDREASIMRKPWLIRGCCAMGVGEYIYIYIYTIKLTLLFILGVNEI